MCIDQHTYPILHKIKATWKHIHKLTICKIIVSLQRDFPSNDVFPQCSYFGLDGKSTFMLLSTSYISTTSKYKIIEITVVMQVEITVVILPVLLHQCRRSNRVISFPRKKRKNPSLNYKPSQDLFNTLIFAYHLTDTWHMTASTNHPWREICKSAL